MKRLLASLVACTLCLTTLSGCYGRFALTRKLYQVNGQVGDKYLRSGVTWVFLWFPVYFAVGLVDFLVLNTIEFWSGKNPMTMKEKTLHFVDRDGSYDVRVSRNGDTVFYDIRKNGADGTAEGMDIAWDLRSGNSTGIHHRNGTDTVYTAVQGKEGVDVRNVDAPAAAR